MAFLVSFNGQFQKISVADLRQAYNISKSKRSSEVNLHTENNSQSEPKGTSHFSQAYKRTEESKRSLQKNFYAKDIMTSPTLIIRESQKITEAFDLMNKKNIRHLPVLDEKDLLCGIISDRDILNYSNLRGTIKEAMTKKVITCMTSTLAQDIARVMVENKVGALPVVDKDYNVVGMITNTDILELTIKHFHYERSI